MSMDNLNDDALLRVKHLVNKGQSVGICGVSRTSLYRLLELGQFPKPVRLLGGVVAWRVGDVRQWLRSQV